MIKHRQDGSLAGVKSGWRMKARLTAYSVILITALFFEWRSIDLGSNGPEGGPWTFLFLASAAVVVGPGVWQYGRDLIETLIDYLKSHNVGQRRFTNDLKILYRLELRILTSTTLRILYAASLFWTFFNIIFPIFDPRNADYYKNLSNVLYFGAHLVCLSNLFLEALSVRDKSSFGTLFGLETADIRPSDIPRSEWEAASSRTAGGRGAAPSSVEPH